ncbi:MAG: phage terminase large subunit, partial [Blastocatellia bacterium]
LRRCFEIIYTLTERRGFPRIVAAKPQEYTVKFLKRILPMLDTQTPDFDQWICTTAPTWTWDWPHQLFLYEQLRRVTDGECKRLMIFMPPRHSKSETVTVRYSAWRMILNPSMNVILASYNQRLANRFSRKIKRIAAGYVPLSAERKAVDEWETVSGGGLCAVGVGAGVTGYGAELIMIDDPVKNRAESESTAYRENLWDWFNDDIYTRLEPGGTIMLIQTRWHEDDLAGRLIKEMEDGGEQWDVVLLPALAESGNGDPLNRAPGKALCPERFDEAALEKIRRKLGSYSFSALYQQRPVPLEGGLFKRAWLTQVVDSAPDGLRWHRGYDLAVSTKTSADYTASFRCALDRMENLYIADGFRKRIEYPDQRRYILDRMEHEKNTVHCVEEALHGKAIVQDIRKESLARKAPLRSIRVDSDKVTRALAWAALAEAGKVFLVRGPWIDEFLDEACSFPNGRHDDQVDAVSLAVKMTVETNSLAYGF